MDNPLFLHRKRSLDSDSTQVSHIFNERATLSTIKARFEGTANNNKTGAAVFQLGSGTLMEQEPSSGQRTH